MNRDNAENRRSLDHDGNLIVVDRELVSNPLTVVRGYLQLLHRRVQSGRNINDGELLRILELMDTASRRLVSALDESSVVAPPPGQGERPQE